MIKISNFQSDAIWIGAGQILSAVAVLAMMKVWSVYLEPEQLGLMALTIGVPSIILGIVFGPLFQGIFIYYQEYSLAGKGTIFRYVCLRLIKTRFKYVLIIISLASVPVCVYFDIYFALPLLVIGLLAVDTIRVFNQRLLAASRRQRTVSIVTLSDTLFRFLLVWISLSSMEPSAIVAITGNFLGAALFLVALLLFLSRESHSRQNAGLNPDDELEIENKILDISKPLLPSMILANLTEIGNRYFIAAILGLHSAGLFVVGYNFVKRPYGMLNNVGELTVTPILRDHITNDRALEASRFRVIIVFLISSVSVTGALLFFALRDLLVSFFLSSNYLEVSDMLFGLAIAISFYNIANVFNWYSLTLGDSKAVLLNNMAGSITTVILTVVFCFKYGVYGAVWALACGYCVQLMVAIITYRESKRKFEKSLT